MTKLKAYFLGATVAAVIGSAVVVRYLDMDSELGVATSDMAAPSYTSQVDDQIDENGKRRGDFRAQRDRTHAQSTEELIEQARAGDLDAARTLYLRTYMCFDAERNRESLKAYASTSSQSGIGRMFQRMEAQNRACSRLSPADLARGREAMEIAAFNGNAAAQSLLLDTLALPQMSSVADSAAQAELRKRLVDHLEERAAQGDAGAMGVLGEALALGSGLERDPVRGLGFLMAANYLGNAANEPSQGVPSPRGAIIHQLMNRLTPTEIGQAETIALELVGDS